MVDALLSISPVGHVQLELKMLIPLETHGIFGSNFAYLFILILGQIFLLVDLREFFSDLGSGVRRKINKKALKMTS